MEIIIIDASIILMPMYPINRVSLLGRNEESGYRCTMMENPDDMANNRNSPDLVTAALILGMQVARGYSQIIKENKRK